jgi:hypothetical protein
LWGLAFGITYALFKSRADLFGKTGLITRRIFLEMAILTWIMSRFSETKAEEIKFKSIEDLREIVIERISQIAPSIELLEVDSTDPAKFTVKISGNDVTADVTNIFNSLRADPDQNEMDLIDRFARILLPMNDPKIGNLVTLIRTPGYVDQLGKDSVISEAVVGDLIKLVMQDTPDSLATVPPDTFPNKSKSDLMELGTANVLKTLPNLIFDYSLPPIVLCYVDGNPGLTSGLLLTDNFWSVVGQKVSDDIYVALPRRDQVFLIDSKVPDAQSLMKSMINATFEDDFFLMSDLLYRYRNRNLEVVGN